MAAPSSKSTQAPKPAAVPASASNASIRLEKSHPGIRRSTPDSEALASSDDEVEQHQQTQAVSSAPAPKAARRTSWLNEVPPNIPRKASLPAGSSLSSAGSNPATPAIDQSTWAASTSPGLGGSVSWTHTGTSSFPWSTGIWNAETRKEPPPRLTEIVQSSSIVTDEVVSPTTRTLSGDSSFPFTIPLYPTPKTYRSQSYSVGQLDPESVNLTTDKAAALYSNTRGRGSGQYSALQHRSSRPSLLGELGHDPVMLGRVREDDGDEGSANGSDGSYNLGSNAARTIEQLSRENALLRQAAGQLDNSRLRDRAVSSASANSGYSVASSVHNLHRIRGSVPEESDLAVEDLDELGDIPGYNNIRSSTRRRFSEYSANLEKQFPTFSLLENRALENVKRAHWQTSLGFGSIADLPQSRRHSFADLPLRHSSISSAGDSQANISGINTRSGLGDRDEGYTNFAEGTLTNSPGENPSYFSGREHALRAAESLPSSGIPPSLHPAYPMPTTYGRQQQSNLTHPHQNQLLYIVTFKCHRADVFYIQEDTGLQVKPGDLVIVEADRGTDLGTIQHANVTLQKARELKEKYAEEHYKWLMLFSRQAQNGASNGVNPNGGLPGRSAMGGMGHHGLHGPQESQATEIKPKLIKRLAQNHEILTLRDKEGNEAKAKRVCQQKVAEHRLNMEILDAEFQMDWKKLTFYYFADTYINFNALVTDLFKIYKTRIWMSAINPASFASPTAGLQPPSLGYGQETSSDRRHHHDHRTYGLAQSQVSSSNARDPLDASRDAVTNPAPRQPELGLTGFAPMLQPQIDPFSPCPSNGYGMLDSGVADYTTANSAGPGSAQRTNPVQSDWINRFQGLSLGS